MSVPLPNNVLDHAELFQLSTEQGGSGYIITDFVMDLSLSWDIARLNINSSSQSTEEQVWLYWNNAFVYLLIFLSVLGVWL